MHDDPTVGLKFLFAIFLIGIFFRLVTTKRIGLLVLVVFAGIFLTYGLRQSRMEAPPAIHSATLEIAAAPVHVIAVMEAPSPPPQPEKPARPKRGPKSKAATKAVPAAPAPALPTNETPPEPPVAAVAEATEAPTPSEPVDEDAPLTLYQGSSAIGRPIDSLPEWVKELSDARPGSNAVAFSSDRFATIEEAEKQLWDKTRDFVARDLRTRIPDAVRWSPSVDLLKRQGLILERCVERTQIEVGKFVEPMYRVHWKASLSKNVRDSVVNAWRPTVQEQRLEATALGFLGVAAFLAFVNIILRLAPCPNAKKTPPAAT